MHQFPPKLITINLKTALHYLQQIAKSHSLKQVLRLAECIYSLNFSSKTKLPEILDHFHNQVFTKQNQLLQIIKEISNLAYLSQRKIQKLHTFKQKEQSSQSIPRQTIGSMLALMFFGLVQPNFKRFIFQFDKRNKVIQHKLLSIMFFFAHLKNNLKPQKPVLYQKIVNKNLFTWQQLIQSEITLGYLEISDKKIEDYIGQIQVDFANQYIGGGSLSYGSVQEQIIFANCPQLYPSMLMFQVMENNQAIYFQNIHRDSIHEGYGNSTKFKCQCKQLQTRNFICIDALFNPNPQFSKKLILRQINKSFTGFSTKNKLDKKIVTGNWGCGVFGGNKALKLIIQWIACTLAKREMVFCHFGWVGSRKVWSKLRDWEIGKLLKRVEQFQGDSSNFEEYILGELK